MSEDAAAVGRAPGRGMPGLRRLAASRVWVAAELAAVFVLLPVALLARASNAPLIPAFAIVFAVCQVAVLFGDRSGVAEGDRTRVPRSEWRLVLVRFVALGALLTAGVALLDPGRLFNFPRQAPLVWLAVMLLYPLLSAYPQEVIYRAFFFRRYAALFGGERTMVVASALAFSWLHVLLENGIAIVLTLAGGLLFGATYRRTGSLFAATVEHALYGALIFTIGLGREFYLGSVRP